MRGHGKEYPKYRKHRGSGQAIVTLNGRDFYLGPHGTKISWLEYDRLIAEWLAAGRRTGPEPESVTVLEIILAFLRHGKTHYRNKDGKATGTLENFKLAFAVLKQHYGRKPANEFGPRALGNRSIIVDPRRAEMKEILNERIKKARAVCSLQKPIAQTRRHRSQHTDAHGEFPQCWVHVTEHIGRQV